MSPLEVNDEEHLELVRPTQKDFKIPETEEEFNKMINGLLDQGLDKALATKIISDRVDAFELALKNFNFEKKERILAECFD